MQYNPYQYQQGYQPTFQPTYPQNLQPTYQQGIQRRGLSGRQVSSLEEIQVQEIPTDGSVALFPLYDNSCVFVKKWDSDGTIRTVKYVPQEIEEERQPDTMSVLNSKLDKILETLNGRSDNE